METLLGFLGLGFILLLGLALNKDHKEQTGVNAPTAKTFRRFYRKAAQNGTSPEAEYQRWLSRKQTREHNKILRQAGIKPPRSRRKS